MGQGGITLIGAITNSLLYSIGDREVSMGQGGKTLIGAFTNSLLYSIGDR